MVVSFQTQSKVKVKLTERLWTNTKVDLSISPYLDYGPEGHRVYNVHTDSLGMN